MNSQSHQQEAQDREFSFTTADFNSIRTRLNDHAGIVLSDIKQDMVYNRLARRLRVLGLHSVGEYLNLLDSSNRGDEEFVNFINALTTNLTAFFREPHHFQYLSQQLLPQLQRQKNSPIRIWSAGCSIGEEAYTLAITLDDILKGRHPAKILATDIDTNVLEVAQHGIYDQERVQKLDPSILRKAFLKGKGHNQGMVRVKPHIRQLVSFKPLNLMTDWPIKQPFDIIFCRNVMIYFDKPTQLVILKKMIDRMNPQGIYVAGHSENFAGASDLVKALGNTVYQPVAQ